jgi:RNA polymerase sigma factor (sigma-70 family)
MVRLGWDSTGLANVVCKDFELTREIRGRVLAQRHLVSGALRLHNNGESLTATPVFPERRIRLKLDLTAPSWGVVEAALRSQDTSGKCGALMDPDKGLVRLRALAARGIRVRLPDSIFRAVSLPARLQKSVKVSQRTVELQLTAESLRIETATLWSSVSVQVQAGTKPFVPRPGTRKGSSYSSPAENVINLNLKEQTDALLKTLTPREERVIKMRFGIGDGSEHTLEDVGQSFQVTRERVRQTEAKALRKLRHPSRSRKLKAFLEGSRI